MRAAPGSSSRSSSAWLGRARAAALVLLSLAGALPRGAVAQAAPWPDPVVARVVELVADRLAVDPTRVVLEWGPVRGEPVAPEAAVVLVGAGSGGHWVVRATLVDGRAVGVRVRGGRLEAVPIAARAIPRGATLAAEDIAMDERVVWGAQVGRLEGHDVQPGWVAQRVIPVGTPLVEPAVQPPMAVTSGRPIQIWWGRGGVRIRIPGTAADSGRAGDRIAVRTRDGVRLFGIVRGEGVVDVSDPMVIADGGWGR